MFKQQQKEESNNCRQKTQRREEGTQPNRIAGLGIKVISNWMDDRKGNNVNQSKRQNGRSPILKTDTHPQQPSRVASTRGIKVISSRQSSNDRPQIDSRSNSRQKQSKQIKSQTNISDFDSPNSSKDPFPQKQQIITKYIDQQSIIDTIQHRFKQAILKQKTMHDAQVCQLRQIIFGNQQRIDNLIATLNQLVEGGQRKDKGLGRLQNRLNSNQRYAEQSYQYTVNRCKDSEVVLRHISDEIHNNFIKNTEIQNKMEYIQRIIIDIFTVQRILSYKQQSNFHSEIRKMEQSLSKLQQKWMQLQRLKLKHSLQDMKSINWKEQIIQLRQKLQNDVHGKHVGNETDVDNNEWINKEQLAIKIQNIESKLVHLQNTKKILQDEYRQKEQNSQHAIWQLSSLLNKQQRQFQKAQKQNISLLSYNKQIQNKLIESKHRENSMHSYMQSQLKSIQISVINQQNSRILAENEVFRQKYEELLRHKHYLQDINCKNKLELINQGKILQQLHEKLKEQEMDDQGDEVMDDEGDEVVRLQYRIVSLEQEIQALKRRLSEANRKIEQKQSQFFAKSMQLQAMTVQSNSLKSQFQDNTYKIQNLQIQIAQFQTKNEALSQQSANLHKQLFTTRKELEQEQLYSEHLQKQNQKLEIKMQQYSQNFEQQSQMFRTTIDRLKRQRQLIKYNEPKTDRQISSNPPQTNLKTTSQTNASITKAQQQKLLRLKKAIDAAGYKKPVPCQIDGSGYLKHLDEGTYIMDAHQNLFQLSLQEKHLAIRTNLIQLFQ